MFFIGRALGAQTCEPDFSHSGSPRCSRFPDCGSLSARHAESTDVHPNPSSERDYSFVLPNIGLLGSASDENPSRRQCRPETDPAMALPGPKHSRPSKGKRWRRRDVRDKGRSRGVASGGPPGVEHASCPPPGWPACLAVLVRPSDPGCVLPLSPRLRPPRCVGPGGLRAH